MPLCFAAILMGLVVGMSLGARDSAFGCRCSGLGIARPRLRACDVLDPQIARRVEERRLHGVKATLSASPRR